MFNELKKGISYINNYVQTFCYENDRVYIAYLLKKSYCNVSFVSEMCFQDMNIQDFQIILNHP